MVKHKCAWLYKQLHGYTDFCMVIQTAAWLYRFLHGYTNSCMVIQIVAWFYRALSYRSITRHFQIFIVPHQYIAEQTSLPIYYLHSNWFKPVLNLTQPVLHLSITTKPIVQAIHSLQSNRLNLVQQPTKLVLQKSNHSLCIFSSPA